MPLQSRTRVGIHRPERVTDACLQVHTCLAQKIRARGPQLLLHTIGLFLLQRYNLLPSLKQSLSSLNDSITEAFARLISSQPLLTSLSDSFQFDTVYDPHTVRRALQLITRLRPIDPRALADGVAAYVAGVELTKRGLPVNLPLFASRVLSPPSGALVLDRSGTYGGIVWNMWALHRTWSPSPLDAVQIVVASSDRCEMELTQLLATIAIESGCIIETLLDNTHATAQPPLDCHIVIAIPEGVKDGYIDQCVSVLREGGKVLLMLPAVHLAQWWGDQLQHALSSRIVQVLFDWNSNNRSGWFFLVLRPDSASSHHRVLTGRLRGDLVPERIEELREALQKKAFIAPWLGWKKITEFVRGTPHYQETYPVLKQLIEKLGAVGVDIRHILVPGDGRWRFDKQIRTADLLERAVRSAPTLRLQEMRYYYILYAQWAQWQQLWHKWSNGDHEAGKKLTDHCIEQLTTVPLITTARAQAVVFQWMQIIEPDLYCIKRYGVITAVESIFRSIEQKLRTCGVMLWRELDEREECVIEHLFPQFLEQVRHEENVLLGNQRAHRSELDRRTSHLRQKLTLYRAHMEQLHRLAKAHGVSHDARELFDSTMPLQDEISRLLAEMVVVQTELKMLEHQCGDYSSQQANASVSPIVARCTAQLLPSIQQARRKMTPHHAWSLLGWVWYAQLHRIAEQSWERLLTEIIDQVHNAWEIDNNHNAELLEEGATSSYAVVR